MSLVVGVHGINQHLKGAKILHDEWASAMIDGVTAAGAQLASDDIICAFYGGLFRPPGNLRGDPHFRVNDVTDDEADLLKLLWQQGAEIDPAGVVGLDADVRAATPRSIQAALRALSRSSFFASVAERAFIGSLKQVRRYMREPELREAAQEAVDQVVTENTNIIVGHSLGSVVAYEALHRFGGQQRWANVRTFVTLGSPLGISNLIFDELNPTPENGVGVGPSVDHWVNISDDGDVVALEKRLSSKFSGPGIDVAINNGAHVHDIMPYLTAPETGAAIASGLEDV